MQCNHKQCVQFKQAMSQRGAVFIIQPGEDLRYVPPVDEMRMQEIELAREQGMRDALERVMHMLKKQEQFYIDEEASAVASSLYNVAIRHRNKGQALQSFGESVEEAFGLR